MKKIMILILLLFSCNGVYSYDDTEQIRKRQEVMKTEAGIIITKFHKKLDSYNLNVEKRLQIFNKIILKIKNLKKNKRDQLTSDQQRILGYLLIHIENAAGDIFTSKITKVTSKFYKKLDDHNIDIDKKIEILNKIKLRIENIKKNKGDTLSVNTKGLLTYAGYDLNRRIRLLDKENRKNKSAEGLKNDTITTRVDTKDGENTLYIIINGIEKEVSSSKGVITGVEQLGGFLVYNEVYTEGERSEKYKVLYDIYNILGNNDGRRKGISRIQGGVLTADKKNIYSCMKGWGVSIINIETRKTTSMATLLPDLTYSTRHRKNMLNVEKCDYKNNTLSFTIGTQDGPMKVNFNLETSEIIREEKEKPTVGLSLTEGTGLVFGKNTLIISIRNNRNKKVAYKILINTDNNKIPLEPLHRSIHIIDGFKTKNIPITLNLAEGITSRMLHISGTVQRISDGKTTEFGSDVMVLGDPLTLSESDRKFIINPHSCTPLTKNDNRVQFAILGSSGNKVNKIDLDSIEIMRDDIKPIKTEFIDLAITDNESCKKQKPDGYTDLLLTFNMKDVVKKNDTASFGSVNISLRYFTKRGYRYTVENRLIFPKKRIKLSELWKDEK